MICRSSFGEWAWCDWSVTALTFDFVWFLCRYSDIWYPVVYMSQFWRLTSCGCSATVLPFDIVWLICNHSAIWYRVVNLQPFFHLISFYPSNVLTSDMRRPLNSPVLSLFNRSLLGRRWLHTLALSRRLELWIFDQTRHHANWELSDAYHERRYFISCQRPSKCCPFLPSFAMPVYLRPSCSPTRFPLLHLSIGLSIFHAHRCCMHYS